ncbi:MAG: hypothetical protein SFY32_08420 [Bacteroidota bacterium]|nr:hypothetical protein [Bacteroidota bacterium]
METIVLQTKSKSQSKALRAFAKALEIKAISTTEIQDRATAKWIQDGLASGIVNEETTKKFIDSLGK